MWLLLYMGLPAALALLFWQAEKGSLERKTRMLSRSLVDSSVRVRVAGGPGERVSLGSSAESPESISAKPTLTSEEVVLVEEPLDDPAGAAPASPRAARRFRLRAGVSVEIAGLPGARRRPLEIETTESGVRHHYSFEVPTEKAFWISGELAAPGAGGPFREDPTWELLPHAADPAKGRCVVSAAPGALLGKLEAANFGLWGAMVFAAIVFALSEIPYAGPFLWGFGVLFLVLMAVGERGTARESPATPAVEAPPPVRVAAADPPAGRASIADPPQPDTTEAAAEDEDGQEEEATSDRRDVGRR